MPAKPASQRISEIWWVHGPALPPGNSKEYFLAADGTPVDGFGVPATDDGPINAAETTGTFLAERDVFDDPAWKQWLDENMARDDVDPTLRIDTVDRPRLTHGFSKRRHVHTYTYWVPVAALVIDGVERGDIRLWVHERAVIRRAICQMYRLIAASLDLPEPPPDL